jgi:hypothetical protein
MPKNNHALDRFLQSIIHHAYGRTKDSGPIASFGAHIPFERIPAKRTAVCSEIEIKWPSSDGHLIRNNVIYVGVVVRSVWRIDIETPTKPRITIYKYPVHPSASMTVPEITVPRIEPIPYAVNITPYFREYCFTP